MPLKLEPGRFRTTGTNSKQKKRNGMTRREKARAKERSGVEAYRALDAGTAVLLEEKERSGEREIEKRSNAVSRFLLHDSNLASCIYPVKSVANANEELKLNFYSSCIYPKEN